MGPKTAPVVEAPALRNGANLLYVRCSLPGEQQFLTVSMNLNCRVDIILDTSKKALHAAADASIAKINAQIANPEVTAEGAPSASANQQETLARLTRISEAIQAAHGPDVPLELQDEAAASVGVQALLAKNGKDVLKPAHRYVLGIIENGTFKAF